MKIIKNIIMKILNNKKTDFSKKYLNDLEKFKTIEIYKKT